MVTDTKGCVGSNVLMLANTLPAAVGLGGGVTLCVGQKYTLDAGTGWTKVQWGGSGAVAGTTQQLTVKDPGTYWVEVLDAKGCVGRYIPAGNIIRSAAGIVYDTCRSDRWRYNSDDRRFMAAAGACRLELPPGNETGIGYGRCGLRAVQRHGYIQRRIVRTPGRVPGLCREEYNDHTRWRRRNRVAAWVTRNT